MTMYNDKDMMEPASSWVKISLSTTHVIFSMMNLTVVPSYAKRAGITLPDKFVEDFDSDEAAVLFTHMKMCFHVAGSISPLVIFIPTCWTNAAISHGHLLMVHGTVCLRYRSDLAYFG